MPVLDRALSDTRSYMVPYNAGDQAQSQFLAWIQSGETQNTPRAYSTGYSGVDLSDAPSGAYGFPEWSGREGPKGISHGAGAFQFEPRTWESVARKYQLDFRNPDHQRAGAWYLAQEVYRQRTGKSLVDALKAGDKQSIASALSGTWAAPAREAGVPMSGVGAPAAGLSPLLQQLIGGVMQSGTPTAEEKAAMDAAKKANDNEEAVITGELPELDKIQGAITKDQIGAPPKAPALPTEAKEAPGDPVKALGQFLPIMAMLGGAFMRGPALASIKAATGAMKGAEEKDQAAIARHHQQWLDQMTELKDQYELQRDEYDDILKKHHDNLADLQAGLQVWAAKHGLVHDLTAIKMGDLDLARTFPQARQQAMEKLIPVLQSAQEHQQQMDIEQQRLSEEHRHDLQTEQHAGDMIPPATRAYNDAYNEARAEGKSEDDAQKAAVDRLHEVELATHPTAAGAVGLREERNMESDPVIKATRTNSQYITNLESLTPEDLKTGPGQVRLLDSFTRLVTNQAIRQFMVRGAENYQGVADRAKLILARNTGATAPFLTPAQVDEYLREGKEAVDEIRKAEGRQLAQHAENMEARGVDPTQGGLTGADLELAMVNGYKPDPTKWKLSNAGDQSGAAPVAAQTPQPLPSKKSDLQVNTLYQLPQGPATWDGTHFVAVSP